MLAINYSNARQNFKSLCDAAVQDCETIFITRKQGENVVLMSEAEYNNILENLFIRSDELYYKKIKESMNQLRNNMVKSVDFETLRGME